MYPHECHEANAHVLTAFGGGGRSLVWEERVGRGASLVVWSGQRLVEVAQVDSRHTYLARVRRRRVLSPYKDRVIRFCLDAFSSPNLRHHQGQNKSTVF